MIAIQGHNIFTGAGFGSEAVYSSAREGRTDLARREGTFGVPEPFMASLIDRGLIDSMFGGRRGGSRLSHLEKAMILSAEDAIAMAGIDPSDKRTLFVISSTKGNVEFLENDPSGMSDEVSLWHSAKEVSSYFGNPNEPVCVTNACTSGICAQIAAMRAITGGRYSTAVVIGADFLSKFIVAGFQSLKALSPERCRPFDAARCGLNLSEAVGTIVFSENGTGIGIGLERGCIRNDANHISAPSRTAVGQIAAIKGVLDEETCSDIAFINVHGTATNYNDSMESVAIHGAGLDDVPAVSYKSIFGHTLGAAGVIETVISSLSMLDGTVLPTAGYETCGVPYPVSLGTDIRAVKGNHFLKIMSGFGGINAATLYRKF